MQDVGTQLAAALFAMEADAVLATDREGTIRLWNPGATRIFGFSPAEAIGASLDIIIPERLRGRHWDGWQAVMASGVTRYGAGDLLAVPALTRDGRQISVEFSLLFLRDAAGAITGMGTVMRDVTARFEELRRLRRQAKPVA